MMFYRLSLLASFAAVAWAQAPAAKVAAAIDDWHQAAAAADEQRYFGHFAPDGVFMGTDATERWTVAQFRVWAKPHFDKKKAWNFKAHDRHVAFSADGATAWFDELLDTPNLGPCRGSGVVVKIGNDWKIAQYNLSIPIPNALADAVVKEIAAAGKKK
jgi:ketosteroid isomerase-like protein